MAERKPALLSKYRLMACLGRGGMAEVYLAVSEQAHGVSKLQVLKTLRRDLSDAERPEYLQMFVDEARLAAMLNHPNIVHSHDVGFEEPTPFIAMEYLDGQALSRIQERQWTMGQRNRWGVELLPVCQVLDALEYAHALTQYDGTPLNVVHRDVSPQNIFITYTGHTKLVDFGIAKTLDSKKTRAGVIKGKVAYMSPEQIKGLPVDHRSDLYSVGVILWETVARQCMHGAEPVLDTLNRVVEGQLPHLKDVAPDAPDELCAITEKALACDAAQRYPNAASFREALDRFLEGQGRGSERELGKVVSELFAKEREEIGQAIRRALAQSPVGASAPDTLRLTPMLGVFSSWNESPMRDVSPSGPQSSPASSALDSHTEKPVQLEPAKHAPPKRTRLLLLAALPLASLVWWLGSQRSGSTSADEAPASAASAIEGPSAGAEQGVPPRSGPTAVDSPRANVNHVDSPHSSASATAAVTPSRPPSPATSPALTTAPATPQKPEVSQRPTPTASRETNTKQPATARSSAAQPAAPNRAKDPFDHDFAPTPRKRPSSGTLDTGNPWK